MVKKAIMIAVALLLLVPAAAFALGHMQEGVAQTAAKAVKPQQSAVNGTDVVRHVQGWKVTVHPAANAAQGQYEVEAKYEGTASIRGVKVEAGQAAVSTNQMAPGDTLSFDVALSSASTVDVNLTWNEQQSAHATTISLPLQS